MPLDASLAALDRLEATCADRCLHVDVIVQPGRESNHESALSLVDPTFADAAEQQSHRSGFEKRVKVRVADVSASQSRVAGEIRAPVVVLSMPERTTPADDSLGALDGRPVIFSALPLPRADTRGGPRYAEMISDDATVLRRLSTPPLDQAWDLLVAYSVAEALDLLAGSFALTIDATQRENRVRRALAQQRVGTLQSRTSNSSLEVTSAIRSRLQQQKDEFLRGVRNRLDATCGPLGDLTNKLDSLAMRVETLDHESQSRRIILRVPPDTLEELFAVMRRDHLELLRQDIAAMNDQLQLSGRQIEDILSKSALPASVPHVRPMTDTAASRVVANCTIIQKVYQGEAPRPGFFEYFMQVRRPLMVVGTIFSSFGLYSLLRRNMLDDGKGADVGASGQSATSTHGTLPLMVPLAVVMLTLGVILVVRRSRQEKKEASARELDRARDWVRGEIRRATVEIVRAWPTVLEEHFQMQIPLILEHVDGTAREYAARSNAQAAEDKSRVQRQLQSIETTERALLQAMRGRELLSRNVEQLKGELQQLLLTTLPRDTGRSA